MKIVMLDAMTLGDDIKLDMFEDMGEFIKYDMTSPDKVIERIKEADIIITNKVKLTKDKLAEAKKVRLICETATGFDNIDINYCKSHDIAVCNVKSYSTESVTELTVSMALSLITHLSEYDIYVKDGSYTRSGLHNYLKPTFNEMSSLTWGIVGLGNIGMRVAEVAAVLGAKVLAYKRTPVSKYECTDIETLCKSSDIISVHLPLTEETEDLINERCISLMKKNAVFINVARGKVADEKALARAVVEGRIGGIGIDVYSEEPIRENHPYSDLYGMDNVILTPHMGWGAYESRVRCMNEIEKNIEAFFCGEKRNRVC